ncbi:MAG: glycosyltransferase family 10 [Thiobacillaceae bacterium]
MALISPQDSNPIRVKVMGLLPTRWWMHQFPGNVPQWDGCTFSFDPEFRDYDWLVVNNELPARDGGRKGMGFEPLACHPRHTMLTTSEPSSIKIYGKAYTEQFGCVLTSQEEWALPHPDRIFSQPALHWFYGVAADHETPFDEMLNAPPVNKTRPISMVYSAKQQRHTLHRKRFNFMQAMIAGLPELDLYGRGATPLDDKAEALDAYRYHIAVENFIGAHHWTEKLADPFLGLTLPFYCGCPNAADYFPPESFIAVDINDPKSALHTITQAIANNEYGKRLPYLHEARRRVMYEYNFFAVVAREIRKRHDPRLQPSEPHTIYSRHALRKRSPLNALRDVYDKARARAMHLTVKR